MADSSPKKLKILALCDHPLSTSGVGIQSRYLFDGLLKTGKYSIRCFGAAVKHTNYDTIVVNEDFVIKPIDGFGNRDMLRVALATEKPDALFLFTDPRFFIWVWEMEEEIHQMCPIVYWHVWDNHPWPEFNRVLYESTDLVNCHSYMTYEMVKERFPEKTNFIPHALPPEMFQPIEDEKIMQLRAQLLGQDRGDHFTCLWINRNAKRKRSNDVIEAWKIFMDQLKEKHGHKKATLIMHTDPLDDQGSNLIRTSEMLGVVDSIFFSKDRIGFDHVATLHNISDCCLNISLNEGFGLGTLEAMQCGKPIIALKTGGLTRQVVDHRDGSENGIALPVEMRALGGSQVVPDIFEDYVSNETTAAALLKMYEMGPEARKKLGQKAREYALSEFRLGKTIADWDRTMSETIETWKVSKNKIYRPWEMNTL